MVKRLVGHERGAKLDGEGDLDRLNMPNARAAPRVDVWLNNGTRAGANPAPAAVSRPVAPTTVIHDLTPLQDTAAILVNSDKGWYHHYADHHIAEQDREAHRGRGQTVRRSSGAREPAYRPTTR